MKNKKSSGIIRHIIPVVLFRHMSDSFKQQNVKSYKYVKGGAQELYRKSKNIKDNNDPNASHAPDINNFDSILKHWGMTRNEMSKVKRGLILEMCAYLLLIGLLFYGLKTAMTDMIFFQLCAIILAVSFLILARYWKYWVLKNKKMVFFKDWLTLKY